MKNKFKSAILWFCLLAFFQSCKNNAPIGIIIDGYTDKTHYHSGDSIQLSIHSVNNMDDCKLDINDVNGEFVTSILCEVAPQKAPDQFAYEHEFENLFSLKSWIPKLESGIYLINNQIPFSVGETKFSFSCFCFLPDAADKDITIDGYTDKFSYQENDTFKLFINAAIDTNNYVLSINDLNGKLVKTILCDVSPQNKPGEFAYEKGFGYQVTLKSLMPNLKSGIYLFDNKVPFLIRSKKQPDIIVLYSSNTENAYSYSGGRSTYEYNSKDRTPSAIVSFHRPIKLPCHSTEFLQWMATMKGYNIGYISDQDLDDYALIEKAKLIVIPGHSEYWTRKARINFDKFVENGNNALILSGNTMWWQVRYNNDLTKLICYKNYSSDTTNKLELKTINWPAKSLNYSVINSIGLDFNHGGMGTLKDYGWDGFKIVNPSSPLLKGSGLKENDILDLKSGEYDGSSLTFSADSSVVKLNYQDRFYRYELIGYDFASRFEDMNRNGAWIVLQKSKEHGVIINTGSTDWCKTEGMKGKDSKIIKQITLNMIDLLLQNDNNKLFTAQNKRN